MKRLVATISVMFVAISAMAQLYAYAINGRSQIQRNGLSRDVFVADVLLEDDLLTTEEYGYIVILDRKHNKKYSLQSPFPQSIQSLIASQGEKAQTLPKDYIQRLYVLLLGYASEDLTDLQDTEGTTYRSESIDLNIAHALAKKTTTETVDFLLLDQHTLQPVQDVKEGQNIVLQIENHSDTPLYTNIIDIDPEGKKYVLLPVSPSDSLSDVYIPPYSKIRLNSNPISFAPGGTSDELTLIAHSKPFNISRVIEMAQAGMMSTAFNDVSSDETAYAGHISMKIIDIIASGNPN